MPGLCSWHVPPPRYFAVRWIEQPPAGGLVAVAYRLRLAGAVLVSECWAHRELSHQPDEKKQAS